MKRRLTPSKLETCKTMTLLPLVRFLATTAFKLLLVIVCQATVYR